MRHVIVVIVLLFCTCTVAQDTNLVGAWRLQTPQLRQQLELNPDGTYQRSIVTSGSRRTEVGRWHSEISVLLLQPDHVITMQGARVPLPPHEKQIDVAGVDANSLTLYYDGDAVETWQRQSPAAASPTAQPSVANAAAAAAAQQRPRRTPRAITLPAPQVTLVAVQIEPPAAPDFLIAARHKSQMVVADYTPAPIAITAIAPIAQPEFAIAADAEAVTPARTPMPAGIYPESSVVELITQIACEELRYPQRASAASARRYQQLALQLGFTPHDPARLQRTLRYYQSNAEFLRAHQRTIADNSLRCAMLMQQVSVVP